MEFAQIQFSNFIKAFLMTLPVILAGLLFIAILKKGFLSWLKQPLDFDLSLRGKRVFGRNKTWLGLVIMSVGTMFFTSALTAFFSLIHLPLDVPSYNFSFEGMLKNSLLGAAYTIGELPNSFLKRQLNISEGSRPANPYLKPIFTVADNIDSILAVSVTAYLIYPVQIAIPLNMLLIGCVVHFLTDVYMNRLGLK